MKKILKSRQNKQEATDIRNILKRIYVYSLKKEKKIKQGGAASKLYKKTNMSNMRQINMKNNLSLKDKPFDLDARNILI